MALITLDKVSLAFGHHILLNQVSMGIVKGSKIGLIGRNGSGKSSLLKALANLIPVDDGQIYITSETKIVYVAQEPCLNDKHTIFDEVFTGLAGVKNYLSEYYATLDLLSVNDSPQLLDRLHALQTKLDQQNGWQAKSMVDKVLFELGLNGNHPISSLSGGLKKKVAIAKALITAPDVLLLDEPTNHLDINTTLWLEEVINKFIGTVILITHDRTFLNNTVNQIIELDRGRLQVYPANYAKYQEWKMQQLANEMKVNHKFDKFLAQEEIWIRKGIEARRTRNEGRVRRLEQLRKLRDKRREQLGRVNFSLDKGELSGKIVAQLDKVNLSLGNNLILKEFNATVMRGDKIGLIGPNGIGKSTLLKVILGQIKPDLGKIKLGTKLNVAYFDQFRQQLDEEATIQDVVSQGQDFVEINGRKLHIATYLEEFLFAPARFRSPVKSLSGGERNRLLLAQLFSRPANVLVLDEPTNDLDMETLELLEELLINYEGTVFVVSHDRTFLDNVVTQSYVFLGQGKVIEFAGGYKEWLDYATFHKLPFLTKVEPSVAKIKTQTLMPTPNRQVKLSYKEKLELEQLPILLNNLEQEQQELQNLLLNGKLYKQDPSKAHAYQLRINEIENEVAIKFLRWEELEQKNK